MSALSEIPAFRAIGDRLGTAGQPTETQFQTLREAGYEVVINLALSTSDHALADERAIVTGLGMEYFHIPVQFGAPTTGDFQEFSRVMDANSARPVFIHCAANLRVSAFVFVYRVRRGVPRPEAERDLHALWQPNEVWSRFIETQLTP